MTNPKKPQQVAKIIRLPCFAITLQLARPNAGEPASGTITSELRCQVCRGAADRLYNAAIDSLESLILAHACAGIDVASPAYIEGIETAVEAIGNHVA